jgi:hypothetical protein
MIEDITTRPRSPRAPSAAGRDDRAHPPAAAADRGPAPHPEAPQKNTSRPQPRTERMASIWREPTPAPGNGTCKPARRSSMNVGRDHRLYPWGDFPVSIKTWERYTHPADLATSRELLERHFRASSPIMNAKPDAAQGRQLDLDPGQGRVSTRTADGNRS